MPSYLKGWCIAGIDFDTHGDVWVEAVRSTIVGAATTDAGAVIDEIELGETEMFLISPDAIRGSWTPLRDPRIAVAENRST